MLESSLLMNAVLRDLFENSIRFWIKSALGQRNSQNHVIGEGLSRCNKDRILWIEIRWFDVEEFGWYCICTYIISSCTSTVRSESCIKGSLVLGQVQQYLTEIFLLLKHMQK